MALSIQDLLASVSNGQRMSQSRRRPAPMRMQQSMQQPVQQPMRREMQNTSFRTNPDMQAIIEAAARGRQRGNAPQARAQRFMRSDPSQMLGMVQR